MFVRLAALVILLVACKSGNNQPPPPPPYDPVNSPEADTQCPAERKAAQNAREVLLETDAPEDRRKTAMAVVAQGRCEEKRFVAFEIQAGSMERLTDQIRAARSLMNTAVVLYEEAVNYGVPEASVGGYTGLGNVHRELARKLRGLTPPADIEDGAGREAFEEEVDELAKTLDKAAWEAYQRALETLAAAPDMEQSDRRIKDWKHEACSGLKLIAGPQKQVHPLCI